MPMFLTQLSRACLLILIPTLIGCSPSLQTDEPTPGAPVDQVDQVEPVDQAGGAEIGDIALLESEADRAAAIRQQICPVSGEPLGSMGKPIKLDVEGREVFICCSGCEDSLREDPEKYFEKLDSRSKTNE